MTSEQPAATGTTGDGHGEGADLRRVLIATDGSPCSAHAAAEACRLLGDAEFHLVAVVPDVPDAGAVAGGFEGPLATPEEVEEERRANRVSADGLLAQTARAMGSIPVHEHVVVDDHPGPGIVGKADELDAAVVVVGSHNKGLLARALLGSVSTHVVRHTGRPVLLVPPVEED